MPSPYSLTSEPAIGSSPATSSGPAEALQPAGKVQRIGDMVRALPAMVAGAAAASAASPTGARSESSLGATPTTALCPPAGALGALAGAVVLDFDDDDLFGTLLEPQQPELQQPEV